MNATRPRPWAELAFAGWLLGVSVPMLVGQALAFVGLFRAIWVLGLSLALLPVLAWAYVREGLPSGPARGPQARFFFLALYALAATLLVLILFPVLFWPRTHLGGFMGGVLAWDVAYYHYPKAVSLVQEGHMWNLAIPYGQYPLGWEMLLALSVGLGKSPEGLGPAAGVALAGFLLGFGLLLARETRWPFPVAAVLVGGMVFSFYLPVPNNPWREFGRVVHYASGIGKNDLLAAALTLALLWHLPLSVHLNARRGHRWGVGLSLAAALAVKPQAGLAAGLLVLLAVTLTPWRPGWKTWAGWAGAGLLGSLWLVRNLVLLGRPFSPVAQILARRAVLYALPQAPFWQAVPKTWLLVTAAVLVLGVWAWRRPTWRAAVAALVVLYALFLLTPAGVARHPARWRVEWRLGLALLAWAWVLLWAWAAHLARQWAWPRIPNTRYAWLGAGTLALLAAGALLTRYGHHLAWEPEYARVLYDPFPQPVGVEGYWSVFDFIHRQVRHGTIDFDSAPPLYVYDPDLTNRAVRPGHYPGGMPRTVPQPQPDHWLFCAAHWGPKARAQDPAAVAQQVAAWRSAGLMVLYADPACALARR